SGKLDRRALAALAPRAERMESAAYREPASDLERRVAEAFAAVLELPRVGADDDFFTLGGHSLLGVRLTSRLAAETGLTVPVRALFERRTPALLAAWLERAERPAAAGIPLRGYQPKGRPRASFAQQRLWFLDRLEGTSSAYHIPVALTIEGPIDLARLRASLVAVVERHEALRTVFAEEAGLPIQVVGPPRLPFAVVDLAPVVAAVGAERAAKLGAELARREAVAPFDLAHGPLIRATVIRFSPEHHRLILVQHHIVSDGGSMPVFVRDFLAFYRAGGAAALEPLPVQYPAFAEWQREHLSGAYLEHLLSYWREQLRDVPVIELPADRLRPAVPVRRALRRIFRLSATTRRELVELTRRTGGTLFMTLLAGFATFVSRLTGQDDFAVGSPIDNRNRREIEGLIGFLVNTLVLRTDLAGDPSFEQLVTRVRETALDAYAHQEVPFERLVEEVGAVRQLATTPLFQVFFVLQNNPRADLEVQGLRFSPAELGLEKAKFDLSLAATETAEGIELNLELDHDLFDPATAERFARRLVTVLSAAAADPSVAVSRLPMLDAAEAAEVLHGANPDRLFPVVRDLLHAPFERQAALRPNGVALIVGEAELSYGELAARSGRLAARLRALGVGPEQLVGVCLERGARLPVALLAVLRAGGAYVPLDPAYPEDRLSFMLEDAGARVVLSERALAGLTERVIAGAGLEDSATALWLDDEQDEEPAPPRDVDSWVAAGPVPENLAYLIYTSGSTGRPKAVAISHQNAATMLAWAEREFAPEERAVVLAATSVSFDLSVFELFLPLAVGATVVLAKNALELPTLPARDRITLVNTVPSAMAELVRSTGLPAAVRTVNLAGEPLKGDLVRRVFEHPGVTSVVNLYGPSEDTTYSTIARLERGDSREPTIGRPIAGSSVHLLDRNLEPVGIGVPGELYLGGAGISRGYLGRPGGTAERFVPDPFAAAFGESGGRLYKTGDLVRRLPDGRLDYLGRLDHQVKVRGFRIELGEIEAALASHPAVSAAAVVAKKDDAGGVLVAWVEVGAEPVLPEAELAPTLAAHLRRSLPEYMVPSFFFALPELPLTPNGKIDRRALLARDTAAATTAREYVAPRTPLETRLCALFAEVLEVPRVGVEDSFFDLGGHSLRATRLVSRVRDELHVELPLREIFQQPTPGGLAPVVAALVPFEATGSNQPAIQPPSLRARPPGSPTPASYSQERLWILEQIEAGTAAYNMPFAVRLVGRWDLSVLAAALDALAARHESLRTTFVTRDGQPFQVVAPPAPVALPVVDLRSVPPARRAAASLAVLDHAAQTPFDLEVGPLLRALAVITADDELLLQLNLHHSICDGWSVSILVREFTAFYSARSLGRSPELAPLPIQYGDYAAWQREWLSGPEREHQLAYWRRQLTGAPPGLDLPFDRPRPAVRSYRGGHVSVAFPRALSDRLRALAAHEGGSLFMVLLAAWKLLLARLSGEHDVVVGSPIAGRGRAEVEGLIGMFLNTLVLRTDVSGNPSFRELVARVRETALGAFAHQDVPFEMLLSELRPERDLSRTPFFQIFFNLLNLPDSRPLDLPDVRLEALATPEMPSKFDLTLYVQPTDEIRIEAVYNADLFDPSTIERFLAQYRSLLGQVAAAPEQPVDHCHLRLPGDARVLPDPEAPLSEAWYGAIHEALERGAAAHPDRLAVIGVTEQVSYRQLDAHANSIAHRLIAGGVVPGDRVVVWAARSVHLPAAVFGVLKTGAAYAMLDPSYPTARLVEMVEMLAPRAIVILEAGGDLPAELDTALVGRARVLVGATLAESGTHGAPGIPVSPDDVAVIGFTSGSTGKPKGIEGRHGPLTHFVPWMAERFGLGSDDRFTLLSGLAHDPLQRDLFTPIQLGATLCVPDPRAIGTPGLMAAWLRAEGITVMHLTPAMAQVLTERPATGEAPQVPSLRRAFLVGDVLTRKDVARLRQLAPGITVVNLYGSTETQRAVSYHQIAPGVEETTREVLPLGRAMADVQLLVLGPDGELAGLGEVGELAMRSPHLAKGYLDDPATTAAKFVGSGQRRLYRTGDLGRYLPNGDAVFVGRADQQVKIRGFRIELGEITGQLSRLPGVREAALILRKDGPLGERLVAFVVPDPGQPAPSVAELRDGLKERLPAYMVPAAFVILGQLPMTPNGKLDRRALAKIEPEIATGAPSAGAGAPRSWLEENLARAFAAVLGRERVGVEDDFAALGVHPSLAAELIAQVRGAVGVAPTEAELFAAGSVAKLAETLEAARQAGRVERTPPPLLPRTVAGPLPLSPLQERLWLAERFEPGSPAHRLHLAVRLRGPVDAAALARAVRVLAGRHELLRTTFVSDGHHTSQIVAPESTLELQRQTPPVAVSFDLVRGPLVAFQLVEEGPATQRLEITAHQLVADAWTLRRWLAELGRIYRAETTGSPVDLPPPVLQYGDYALRQRDWLASGERAIELSYWWHRLADAPQGLDLPLDRSRPAIRAFHPGQRELALPTELVAGLQALAVNTGVDLPGVLLTAWKLLLARLTGEHDVVVGWPVTGRHRPESQDLAGPFGNPLVLRTDLSGDPSFRTLVDRVEATRAGALAHPEVPFELLLEELKIERDLSRTPLFQVAFSVAETPSSTPAEWPGVSLEWPGVSLEWLVAPEPAAKYDLTLQVRPEADGLALAAGYNADLFDDSTLARLLDQYVGVLAQALAEPDARLSAFALERPADRELLPDPTTPLDATWHGPVHDALHRWAAAAPDRIALAGPEESFSYGEYERRVNRLAHRLLQLGVERGDRVAIFAQRTARLPLAVLATLEAGGVFVMLDPSYPASRLIDMLEIAEPKVLITLAGGGLEVPPEVESYLFTLPAYAGKLVLPNFEAERAGTLGDPGAGAPETPTGVVVGPDDLAYIAFTSGSTGKPKGVMGRHGPLSHFLPWLVERFGLTGDDRFTMLSGLAHDPLQRDLFTPLWLGARLVAPDPRDMGTPGRLAGWLEREGLTVTHLTPAMAQILTERPSSGELIPAPSLRRAFLVGDVLTRRDVARLRQLAPSITVVNLYGSTETQRAVGFHEILPEPAADGGADRGREVLPLGRGMKDVQLLVLNPRGAVAGIGEVGELVVRSPHLAAGYLGDAALSAAKFVVNPATGEVTDRLYRTGDLGRYLPNGEAVFVGRADQQVKIRGFRIELGEIIGHLSKAPGVREAVVLLRRDGPLGERLAAYVVPEPSSAIRPTAASLREFLKARVPGYMVPATFVFLTGRMPVTPNNKLDRRALLALDDRGLDSGAGRREAPTTEAEAKVAAIIEDVLKLPSVGLDDNFFDLGGN
ncbi:MAG: amino acid adenylation domain-containing protein, partial [Thermoanaerobaculia bacterium]|nr:amino acid adenylation domain-containing protein [Thermoanaerobaculia bacterium]